MFFSKSNFLFYTLVRVAGALDANGLARTPQLGWNNWNSLGCDVSESLLLDTSSKLLSLGLRDVGYNYVVLDDCWAESQRDAAGYLQEDKRKFPHGMKWIAEQIHAKQLLYGMYSSAGELTCARYPGSLDYEEKDAHTWASWDVDYLKYDNCYALGRHGTPEASFKRYNAMGKALNATGRRILYSLCNWGEDYVTSWGNSIANSWRISGDIYDSWSRPDDLCSCTWVDPSSPNCVAPGAHCSVLSILNRVAPYVDRGQPGGWHDLDMLEVGQGGMTDEEYKAHFALWAAVKSPLLIGADIRVLSSEALSILNNPAIIALNQDPLGRPVSRVHRDTNVPKDRYGIGETQVWSGALFGGHQALILLNSADKDLDMTVYMEDIFVRDGPSCSAEQCSDNWDVYDLWAHRMDAQQANAIVDAAKSSDNTLAVEKIYASLDWYNSTELSYKQGIENLDVRLMGEKVGELKARGEMTINVARHSAKVYRLVPQSGQEFKRYSTQIQILKDEL